MGLFSTKYCSICGNPAGVIGKKKLADGYVCKACAQKFSPFWSVWKSTTVSEVRAHLDYREQNRIAASRFSPAVHIGRDKGLWIDPVSGQFALCKDQELRGGNPDIFRLCDVRECTHDIQMSQYRHDEDHDDYYLYYFYLIVRLNSPNIRTARFQINDKALRADKRPVLHDQVVQVYAGTRELRGRMLSAITSIDRKATEKYLEYYTILQDMIHALSDFAKAQAAQAAQAAPPQSPSQSPPQLQPQSPPQQTDIPRFCPWCGTRSAGAFCPSCGKRITG